MAELSNRLKIMVHQSVGVLGELIKAEFGTNDYRLIENLRVRMTELRKVSDAEAYRRLERELKALKNLPNETRLRVAHAFTLMLQVMNACESAYRSHRIGLRPLIKAVDKPDSMVFVMTAHPTEARTPQNIEIFHDLLMHLIEVFNRPELEFTASDIQFLKHQLNLALKIPIVRRRKPRVYDEAELIYSILLRDETLRTLLKASDELAPIYFRSWVGGDKDGHPGVDEKVFGDSLKLSRAHLLSFCHLRLEEIRTTLELAGERELIKDVVREEKKLKAIRVLKTGDAKRVRAFRSSLRKFADAYLKKFEVIHPSFLELKRLLHVFPGLVVPIEFREASDVLMARPARGKLAIERMLAKLSRISKGGDPVWYVRGFIISMASELAHLQAAAKMIRENLGDLKIPVIPLFEQLEALKAGPKIIEELLGEPEFKRALKSHWQNRVEVMLGYSDSSKQTGVLRSRLQVAETMHAIEKLCARKSVTPIFFQGSGGSTDRGGGTIPEQTAWWSAGALKNYKVTVQGEMVERSLASPAIARGQIERILESTGPWKAAQARKLPQSKVLENFADSVGKQYREKINDPDFLRVIESVTPYPFLNLLKFGSRPSKRSKQVSVGGLRAIPWILCWTQTRLLFPTWWGVGTAWANAPSGDKLELTRLAKTHPVLASYAFALGYTLEKVERPIWRAYIEASDLPAALKKLTWNEFESEYHAAIKMARALLGRKELISQRPWLRESILLRSPMIHPLNLLQIIAMKDGDADLLRLTVVGVSSGMMSTG